MLALRRMLCRFGNLSYAKLKSKQLEESMNLTSAQSFITNYKTYIPYAETISAINKLLLQNQLLDHTNHYQALWQWKYNLPDVIPFCETLVGKTDLKDHQLDLMVMMSMSHPHSQQIVQTTIQCFKSRSEKKQLHKDDARRLSQLCSAVPEAKMLFSEVVKNVKNTSDPQELSLIFAYFCSVHKGSQFERLPQIRQQKNQIIIKLGKLVAQRLYDLSPKQSGSIIGNLLKNTSKGQVQLFLYQFSKTITTKKQQQYVKLSAFIQQFMLLSSKLIKNFYRQTPAIIFNKILQTLELQRSKYGKAVQQEAQNNRYFFEVIISQPHRDEPRYLNSKQ